MKINNFSYSFIARSEDSSDDKPSYFMNSLSFAVSILNLKSIGLTIKTADATCSLAERKIFFN